jgi:hypothetical protein
MVETKTIWTAPNGKEFGEKPLEHIKKLCKPVVWFRKDEQVNRVKKSVFIEHLTEEQQKELWRVLYG